MPRGLGLPFTADASCSAARTEGAACCEVFTAETTPLSTREFSPDTVQSDSLLLPVGGARAIKGDGTRWLLPPPDLMVGVAGWSWVSRSSRERGMSGGSGTWGLLLPSFRAAPWGVTGDFPFPEGLLPFPGRLSSRPEVVGVVTEFNADLSDLRLVVGSGPDA